MLPLLISMVRTRLELAALDTEAHVRETLAVILALFAAAVLGLIVCVFVGITVIAIFWDTYRVMAAAGVTLGFAALAILLVLHARRRWKNRPAAFAATLRELELDAQAFGGRS